jgi:hypothetical protein
MTDSESQQYEVREPRRDVHIDREQHEMFTELQETEESPFYGATNHDLFVFTVGYGMKYTVPKNTEDELAFFGRHQLSEMQQTVIEAVAIKEERDVRVLRDKRRVYEIAEEYANAGVEKLYGRVFGPEDDPLSEITVEIKESYEQASEP